MTNLTNDALSKAIEALQRLHDDVNQYFGGAKFGPSWPKYLDEAMYQARKSLSALSALSQEARPVAWQVLNRLRPEQPAVHPSYPSFAVSDDDLSIIPLYAHPQPAQQDAYAEEQLFAAARSISDHNAEICNVNKDDNWMIYSASFIEDTRIVLDAALAQKGGGK